MAQMQYTFDDILLEPIYNHYESRRMVDTSMQCRQGKLHLDLPILTANMDTVTEDKMANFIGEKGGMGVLHRFMSIEDNIKVFKKCTHKAFVSIGCSTAELERAQALKDAGAQYFCVDVAHAHAKYVGRTLKELRKILVEDCIIAGNVATYAGADYLSSCGADIIKVGIGGGSVCSTRIKTGFGVPTLYSVKQCARIDRSIIADGGIKTPGDIVKALAFGADFVMLGSMFSGTEVTPGEPIKKEDGSLIKRYRGMASKEAHEGLIGNVPEWKTAEGVSTEVPYRQDQEAIVADIIGGLRSGLTYGGAASIRELQRKMNYSVITPAARQESIPHKLLGG